MLPIVYIGMQHTSMLSITSKPIRRYLIEAIHWKAQFLKNYTTRNNTFSFCPAFMLANDVWLTVLYVSIKLYLVSSLTIKGKTRYEPRCKAVVISHVLYLVTMLMLCTCMINYQCMLFLVNKLGLKAIVISYFIVCFLFICSSKSFI